jgi:hypothetical protein
MLDDDALARLDPTVAACMRRIMQEERAIRAQAESSPVPARPAPAHCGRLDPSDPEYARIQREAREAGEREDGSSAKTQSAAVTVAAPVAAPAAERAQHYGFVGRSHYMGRFHV